MGPSQDNYFGPEWVAPLYAANRPDIHRKVVQHVRSVIGSDNRVNCAIDIACGTGLSSRAFAEIADTVIGVDASLTMVREADPHPQVRYVVGTAEQLPCADERFDLATIGCAFHWCEAKRLFSEAARVLRPDGVFVIYDNWFDGEMRECARAREWLRSVYRPRYPLPPRDPIFESEMTPSSYRHLRTDWVEEWIPLTRDQLAGYLTTQSSAIHAVESGAASLEDVEAFASGGLEAVFEEREIGHFRFGGPVSILRRSGPP